MAAVDDLQLFSPLKNHPSTGHLLWLPLLFKLMNLTPTLFRSLWHSSSAYGFGETDSAWIAWSRKLPIPFSCQLFEVLLVKKRRKKEEDDAEEKGTSFSVTHLDFFPSSLDGFSDAIGSTILKGYTSKTTLIVTKPYNKTILWLLFSLLSLGKCVSLVRNFLVLRPLSHFPFFNLTS